MRHLTSISAVLLACSALGACGGGTNSDPTLSSTQVVQAAAPTSPGAAATPNATALALTPVVSDSDAAQNAFTQAVTADLKTAETTPLTNSPLITAAVMPSQEAMPTSGLIPDQKAIVEKEGYMAPLPSDKAASQ